MKKGFLVAMVIVVALLQSCFVVENAANMVRGVSAKTLNADHALFAYEKFKENYSTIVSSVSLYNFQKQDLAEKIGDEKIIANDQLTGMFAFIYDTIATYNADSSKLNFQLFKDKNLPYSLEIMKNPDGTIKLLAQ
jgi:hypothetical protein